jgi:hypothetical protein
LRRGEDEYVLDLAADPQELAPIPAAAAAMDGLEALRAALDHPAVIAAAEAGLVARSQMASRDANDDDVARIEERMRLLGYM